MKNEDQLALILNRTRIITWY